MLNLIRDNFIFYLFFIPVYIGSSFIVPIAPFAIGFLGIIWFLIKKRYDYIVLVFLLTLLLANNKAPFFTGYEKLRVVFIAAILLLSVLIIMKEKAIDPRVNYFIPFFIVAFISTYLFSPATISGIMKVLSYLILVIAIFVFIKNLFYDSRYKLYEHILLLVGIAMLVSLIGMFLYPAVYLVAGRLNGVLGNPNFFGLFCVMGYAFVDHYKVHGSSFTVKSVLILKVLVILCLFLSGSRNAYAAFAIYIILTAFLFRGFTGRSLSVFLVLTAAFVLLQVETVTQFFPFLKDYIRPETIETASGRLPVWIVAIDEIYTQPWLGGGFTYYSYYMTNFAQSHGLLAVQWYGVWNSYLSLLLDVGLIGLVAYFYFIYGVIRSVGRAIFIIPFLITMMFTAIFESWAVSSLNPITPFFLLFFLIIAVNGSRYERLSFT